MTTVVEKNIRIGQGCGVETGICFSSEKGWAGDCEQPHGSLIAPQILPQDPEMTLVPQSMKDPLHGPPHPTPFPESDDVQMETGLQGDLETSLLGEIRALKNKHFL